MDSVYFLRLANTQNIPSMVYSLNKVIQNKIVIKMELETVLLFVSFNVPPSILHQSLTIKFHDCCHNSMVKQKSQ